MGARKATRRQWTVESLEDRRMLAVITVNNIADSGMGSLRDAIDMANTTFVNEANEIVFDPALAGSVIVLTSDLPQTLTDIAIQGPAGGITLRDAVFTFFTVAAQMSDLTLIGGSSTTGGVLAGSNLELWRHHLVGNSAQIDLDNITASGEQGYDHAIRVSGGTLVVQDSTVTNNTNAGSGAGIYAQSSNVTVLSSVFALNESNVNGAAIKGQNTQITISDSTIHTNSAVSSGSAIHLTRGSLSIDSSQIENNWTIDGGATVSVEGQLTIDGSTINANDGAGLELLFNATATVNESQIIGNQGTGIQALRFGIGSLSIYDSDIEANEGDGLYAQTLTALNVSRSTIANNASDGVDINAPMVIVDSNILNNGENGISYGPATGFSRRAQLTLENSTVAGHLGSGVKLYTDEVDSLTILDSTLSGNGIGIEHVCSESYRFQCYGELTRSTVTGNTTGVRLRSVGYYPDPYPSVYLYAESSVIAGNSLDIDAPNDTYAFSRGTNAVGTGDVSRFNQLGDLVGVYDPALGPLANNGGLTLTHRPLMGSPLIDAGDPNFMGPPMYDQRGAPFARVAGGTIDIGAVELQQTAILEDTLQQLGNSSSHSVAMADVDGDGDSDAFVSNSAGGARVYLNDGNGVFMDSGQSIGTGNQTFVQLADLDGDNDPDAVIATNLGNEVWINAGGGVFLDSGQLLGTKTNELALADVDNDGDMDAVTASTDVGEPNRLWINNGAALFTDSGQTLGADAARGVALSDLNGDEHVDLFIVNANAPDRVWLNDGSGMFLDTGQALGNENGRFVAIGDLNGDGLPDAIVANTSGQGNQVWLNDGAGTFTAGAAVGNSDTSAITLGDVDFDGDLDALAANWDGQDNLLWTNDGSGNFVLNQVVGASFGSHAVMEDMDRDGDLDVFLAMFNSTPNEVWRNTTDPLDFNDDGAVDAADIDNLFAEINGGGFDPAFDINHDGTLTPADVEAMLELLGTRLGDANLDGVVDGIDFIVWNDNKFQSNTGWATADFNGDGVTDGNDFLIWNANKQIGASLVARPFAKPTYESRSTHGDDDKDETPRLRRNAESSSQLSSVFPKVK